MVDSEKPRPKVKTTPTSKSSGSTAEKVAEKPAAKKPAPKKKDDKPKPSEKGFGDAYAGGDKWGKLAAKRLPEDTPSWLKRFLIKHSNPFFKVLLVASVILPLAPSVALLAFIVPDRTFGGNFVWWVDQNRSNAQAIVTIIVSTLTYLNCLIISKLLLAVHIDFKDNFVFKFLLSNVGLDNDDKDDEGDEKKKPKKPSDKEEKEEMEKWYEFLTGGKWTFKDFVIGISCFAVLYAPHLIWVGALTPNIVSRGIEPTGALLIPVYSSASSANWANNAKIAGSECSAGFTKPRSNFTGCAASSISESAFANMQTASLITLGDIAHAKADNTSYTYVGRSYGVGSAGGVAFVYPDVSRGISEGRTYTEPGYWTNVQCVRNSTSAFQLNRSVSSSPGGASVNLFQASGRVANGNQTVTPYSLFANSANNDAVAWATSSSGSEHTLSIAVSGQTYSSLDKIQCTIAFTPSLYQVFQNYSSQEISVQQLDSSGGFNPAGLANTAVAQLGILSQFQASPYTSTLGESLDLNSRWLAAINDRTSPAEADFLGGVADAITVALDDILAYVAASQFEQTLGTGAGGVDYVPLVRRVQLGTKEYISVAMFLTGVLFVLGVARIAFRAHRKKHPKPDEQADPAAHGEPVLAV